MLLYNARNNNQGFTLIEVVITLILVGVLSAIITPSFLGILNKNKVNDALDQARGALQQAQREALRKSKTCIVALTPGNQSKLASNCFLIADYTIKASAAAAAAATSVSVDALPVAISNGTRVVFSKGATGLVSANASQGATSLTIGAGISSAITSGETVSLRNLKDVNVDQNNNAALWTIVFDFKGRTNEVNSGGTIVFSQIDSYSSEKKCLVVSQGLGIIRTGDYTGTGATAANCNTSKNYKT
jgi:prepilin-type N-terminal cleavage/methylation domain-containing protein